MSEWQQKYLKDIVDIRVSNVDKKIYPNKSFVKLCNYMDAYSNDYITSKISFSAGSADANEVQRFGLKINDVMITKDSETPEDIAVSSVVIEELENVVCGYHLAILRPVKDELDGKFLMLKLKQPELKNYFYSVANGSTRYGLTIGNIESAKIQYPTLPEQQQIARILSTCDAVIEKTQAAIDKHKAIKQGMLHDLFTRGIDPTTGKLRPKYEDTPELYKESKLGMMPKEWEEKQLSEIVDRLSPVTYGIVQPGKYDPDGILLIRGQDYISGWAKEPEFFRVCEKLHKQFIRSKITRGDILMCIVGATYGAVSVAPEWIEEANITQTTARIRCDKNNFSPLYLEYYLKSEFGKYFINKYVKGSAQPGLNLGDIDKFIIRFPKEFKEQKLIGESLQSIDRKIISEQTYLNKLQQLKAGLMSDLLSGKKRVAVPEEAVAAAN